MYRKDGKCGNNITTGNFDIFMYISNEFVKKNASKWKTIPVIVSKSIKETRDHGYQSDFMLKKILYSFVFTSKTKNGIFNIYLCVFVVV